LFGLAASAQDGIPPETTAIDKPIESPADDAVESPTDNAGEAQESSAETDKPKGDELEDVASETEEPFEVDPAQPTNIEEIVIHGEQGTSLVKDETVSTLKFTPEFLSLERIKDIRDLSNFTPSLEIKSAYAASNPTIYIRGVGLDDFNANAAGAVAIYQDGVYMQSPAGQLFQFYDVEAVEVLRGPQGTLYRNASAGAILLKSKEPSDEFSAELTTTYGNYDLIEVEGFVGGPILPDVLSGRISGTWGIRDGITKNRCAAQAGEPDPSLLPPPCNEPAQRFGQRSVDPGIGDWANDLDAWAARGQLLYDVPLRETSMQWLVNVHGGQNNGRAFQYQHTGVFIDPNDPSEIPKNIGGPDQSRYRDRDGGDPFAGDYNVDGPEDIDLWGANLKGIWRFGDDAYELQSLTAYEWHDLYRLENTDGGPNFFLESEYTDTAWQLSQQLELRGPIRELKYGDGDWTLGAYYLQEDLDVSNFYDVLGGADLYQEYTQEMWNAAGYALLEYRLRPGCERVSCDFTFLAGARYNLEHKSFDTSVVETPSGPRAVRKTLDGKESELRTGASGELSLAWNFSDDSSLYLKYSRGWKGGHFNGGAVSKFDIITEVDPEIVDSYEAGLRFLGVDDRLTLNLTGFYYDYQDLQVFVIEQTRLGYPIPKLVNATDATVYGVELDLMSEPIPGLYLTLNAAWVESEYDEFVVAFTQLVTQPKPCPRCPRPPPLPVPRLYDYTGNTLIASPNFSVTGSIEYDIPLPGQVAGRGLGTLTPRFSFSWKDELLYDACGGRGNRCNFEEGFFGQEPFWVLNAALTWASEDDRLTLTGWVHNFLDEHYKSQSFDLSRGIGVILDAYEEPRTYGITATLAF
jgi:iron complex outermembrane receptor protein